MISLFFNLIVLNKDLNVEFIYWSFFKVYKVFLVKKHITVCVDYGYIEKSSLKWIISLLEA